MCILYRGGKKRVAKKIIERLPRAEFFIDVFGGSGCVSTAAVRSGKYNQVVYNDLDSSLVTFLKTVRDCSDELIEYLCITPLGRHLLDDIDTMLKSENIIERSAGVFFSCNFQNTPVVKKSSSLHKPRIRHKNSVVYAKKTFYMQIEKLQSVVDDLSEIYFENRSVEKILKLYPKAPEYTFDSGNVNMAFFLDPPYGQTQDYPQKFSNHELLLNFFSDTQWTVALCSEENQFPELADYEVFPFVDSNGNSTRTFKKTSYRQGMYVKFREGWEMDTGMGFSGKEAKKTALFFLRFPSLTP